MHIFVTIDSPETEYLPKWDYALSSVNANWLLISLC